MRCELFLACTYHINVSMHMLPFLHSRCICLIHSCQPYRLLSLAKLAAGCSNLYIRIEGSSSVGLYSMPWSQDRWRRWKQSCMVSHHDKTKCPRARTSVFTDSRPKLWCPCIVETPVRPQTLLNNLNVPSVRRGLPLADRTCSTSSTSPSSGRCVFRVGASWIPPGQCPQEHIVLHVYRNLAHRVLRSFAMFHIFVPRHEPDVNIDYSTTKTAAAPPSPTDCPCLVDLCLQGP